MTVSDPFFAMKRVILENDLRTGSRVAIILDPRHPDVTLPDAHKHGSALRLDLSHTFVPRIPIVLDDKGITTVLSFDGAIGRLCFIPWAAMMATYIVGSDTVVYWEVSVPADVDIAASLGLMYEAPPVPKPQRHLRLVKDDE